MVSRAVPSNENSILTSHTPISTPPSPIETLLIALNISAQLNGKLTSSTFP
ncbi:CCHC-type integrase, partial, partial [Olea europaea subsp. europaea]